MAVFSLSNEYVVCVAVRCPHTSSGIPYDIAFFQVSTNMALLETLAPSNPGAFCMHAKYSLSCSSSTDMHWSCLCVGV